MKRITIAIATALGILATALLTSGTASAGTKWHGLAEKAGTTMAGATWAHSPTKKF